MDRLQELVRLHRMKTSAREIVRLLKMGPNTERSCREAIAAAGLLDGPVDDLPSLEALKAAIAAITPARETPAQQCSTIEPSWQDAIAKLVEKKVGPRA